MRARRIILIAIATYGVFVALIVLGEHFGWGAA